MDATTVGLIGTLVFVILIVLGMWIGFAAAVVGLIGLAILRGWEGAAGVAGFLPYTVTASFELSVIPLFIIMGYFAFHAGLSGDLFHTARQWFGHFPGGLAIATTFGAAAFGACTGSTSASAAVFAKIAIPEMKRYSYDMRLASGSVAAAGTLAAMIPPSVIMAIYGMLTEQSIGTLLIAGFVPGILQAFLFAALIYIWCRVIPQAGPGLPAASWKERIVSLKGSWGMLVLIAAIMGGLYTGVFSATEAGGIGAFVSFVMAVALRKLTWPKLRESLLDTGKTTAMIFISIIGILILLRFLALSGVTQVFTQPLLTLPLPPLGILAIIIFIYLILGMFIAAIGMMVLTLPFVFPVVVALGYDPIWFGILMVTLCEIAIISPPVAINIYTVKAMCPEIPSEDIMRGVVPFIIMCFVFIVIMIAFPDVVLWLPRTMRR